LGKNVGSGLTVTQVIVSEMVPHSAEYYLAVKSVREGADLMLASVGGIEIESQWDKVQHVTIEIGEPAPKAAIEAAAKKAGFSKDLAPKVVEFAQKLYQCYDQEDAQYLEINPLVLNAQGELVALDAVTLLDADAKFRHPDWNFAFAAEFGRAYTKDELDVMAVDSKIKGSVKFIQIPGGNIAMLPAGGGASVYYSDAVVARGGKLANYAEYSGDPPDWAVEVLTEKVASLPDIKHIIVGGAIANFTDVKKTFGGIIAGFRKAKADGKLKGVKIWVRRGGPNEKEGLELMRKLKDEGFDIHVYDRKTPLTDIVDMALQKKS
ncbi:MAG TPA: ATP citrate lyase citrate-binding domain-containing protein, partial [Rhodospirillales bacterium]